jgi:AraC-like DNA-binding protein
MLGSFAYGVLGVVMVPALPLFESVLHTNETGATWLLTAFFHSAAGSTAILGRLGDMYGKRRVLLITLAILAAGTLISAVSSSLPRAAGVVLPGCSFLIYSPRARLLLEVVAVELARAPQESLRLPEPNDTRLKAVTNLLHADPADPATLAQLGRRTGSSERTLSRLFGSELSISFHQWRTLLRIQRALLELGEGTSVTDTARRLGWANPSTFIDAFTELVGQTPGRYRFASRS